MKIVLLSLFLLCGQLLFANFSQPVSAPHSLVLSQYIDNQPNQKQLLPLLPIEPAKPKASPRAKGTAYIEDLFHPFIGVPVLLFFGFVGMLLFSIGFHNGIIWLWRLGAGMEIFGAVFGLISGILGFIFEGGSGEWITLNSLYQFCFLGLLLFGSAKGIQFLLLNASLGAGLFFNLGLLAFGLAFLSLLMIFISFL